MARYTVSFVDAAAARRREVREASSVEAVVASIEQEGGRDVVVHRFDILPAGRRDLAQEAASYEEWRGKSTAGVVWRNAREWVLTLGVLALSAAVLRWLGAGVPTWIYVAALCGALGLVLAATPSAIHARIRRALIWRDWQTALRLCKLLSLNPVVTAMPAMRVMMAFNRAKAIAGLGGLPAGLALFEAAATAAGLSASRIDAMKASICTTERDHDAAIDFYRRAVADPGHELGDIDLAIALVRRRGDVEGAKQVLRAMGDRRMTEEERAFRLWAEALIGVEEKRFDDALVAIDASQQRFVTELPASMSDDLHGLRCITSACRCAALAGLGRVHEARTLFQDIAPFLEATQEHELLAQCRRALESQPLPTGPEE